MAARTPDTPNTAPDEMSRWPAALVPLDLEPDWVADGVVPAPPGLERLPAQVNLPLMTLFWPESGLKWLQISLISPVLCMLKAPRTLVRTGIETLRRCQKCDQTNHKMLGSLLGEVSVEVKSAANGRQLGDVDLLQVRVVGNLERTGDRGQLRQLEIV